MLIDEFRIRLNHIQKEWKNFLAKKLIDIVTKLNYEELAKVEISTKINFELKQYIPQDGKWHNVSVNTDFFICNKKQKQSNKIYIDGERTNRKKRVMSKRQEKILKTKEK